MAKAHLYLAVFGVVLSTLVLPLPEEMALLGAGFLAQQGQIALAGAFAASWLAIALGDAVTFYLGRLLLEPLLASRLGRRLIRPDRRRWAERLVARKGWRAILLGRFLVALRGPVYLALGASRYPPPRFLAINCSVALVEVGLVVALGYAFGSSGALVGRVRWIHAAIAFSVLAAFAIPWALGRWLRKSVPPSSAGERP
jgi:membrane protein DedA with SNARE-associated domain